MKQSDIGQYPTLKVGSYFSVKGGTVDKMMNKISVGGNSKFFPVTKAFEVNKEVLDRFYNPPVVRLGDIKDSPKKRRITFEGRVGQDSRDCNSLSWLRHEENRWYPQQCLAGGCLESRKPC
ncbi:uncharacterized protein LOC121429741 [Lytechinus variegatus]|uniref:uncharacterized protein LOC121429741 n=1 Tax=Lytechinus variegatus TaxID=7654 RepID=UPI001BB19C9B|nr:uncharacterized protein LOC121429741 [Lytechinus variegatus]